MIELAPHRIEHIARRVCERRGLDPNEAIPQPPVPGHDMLMWWPRWMAVAEEVRNFVVMREVLIEELGSPA